MQATSSLLTAEDYKVMAEGPPWYQLVDGILEMAPAPNRFHQQISRNLEFIIFAYLKQHPLGEIYNAPFDVYLNETNVFQPDLVYVSNENAQVLVDAGIEGVPDLVVEILSPSNFRLDRGRKLRVYAAMKVPHCWIIEPSAERIEIWNLEDDLQKPAARFGPGDFLECPLFPGLKIDVAEVFAR